MWGEGSKNYSEEVIKTYICKHGAIVEGRRNQQLSVLNLAAIHAGGSSDNTRRIDFGREVAALIRNGKFKLCNTYI